MSPKSERAKTHRFNVQRARRKTEGIFRANSVSRPPLSLSKTSFSILLPFLQNPKAKSQKHPTIFNFP
ncbi:Phosphatidylinositol 4-kinase [Corchorus olitorius]|uniref:Phosphatidylinositol 4-kinase n=1 Tax=Corchorus olitorius TaxID=93759 RepID=A0A1R3I5X8_9ROSI|nr:Phosphatidylinositol 4-kinase [Corchorus olitorius]